MEDIEKEETMTIVRHNRSLMQSVSTYTMLKCPKIEIRTVDLLNP